SIGPSGAGINLTSGTSTFSTSGGLNLTAGCYAYNGTCLSTGAGSGTVNNGLQGQTAFYNSDGTAVSATSTVFISTNSFVGIGTTTPAWNLDIAGVRPFIALSD